MIEYKKIVAAFLCIVLFTVNVMAGLFCSVFFVFAAAFIGGYLYIDKKFLRCPHCGKFENLDRLFFAAKHTYHCKHCGNELSVKK